MSLEQKLAEIRAGAVTRIPPAALVTMQAATATLRASGIMDGTIKVGARLPPFALSNQRGTVVDSPTLLARGGIVLSVFRGHW